MFGQRQMSVNANLKQRVLQNMCTSVLVWHDTLCSPLWFHQSCDVAPVCHYSIQFRVFILLSAPWFSWHTWPSPPTCSPVPAQSFTHFLPDCLVCIQPRFPAFVLPASLSPAAFLVCLFWLPSWLWPLPVFWVLSHYIVINEQYESCLVGSHASQDNIYKS